MKRMQGQSVTTAVLMWIGTAVAVTVFCADRVFVSYTVSGLAMVLAPFAVAYVGAVFIVILTAHRRTRAVVVPAVIAFSLYTGTLVGEGLGAALCELQQPWELSRHATREDVLACLGVTSPLWGPVAVFGVTGVLRRRPWTEPWWRCARASCALLVIVAGAVLAPLMCLELVVEAFHGGPALVVLLPFVLASGGLCVSWWRGVRPGGRPWPRWLAVGISWGGVLAWWCHHLWASEPFWKDTAGPFWDSRGIWSRSTWRLLDLNNLGAFVLLLGVLALVAGYPPQPPRGETMQEPRYD